MTAQQRFPERPRPHRLAILLALACLALGAHGADGRLYVRDILRIDLRDAPDVARKALRTLPSGTALDVIGASPDGKFVQVRDPEGNEGWVLGHFLMDEPAARDQLAEARARLAEAEAENARQGAIIRVLEDEKAGQASTSGARIGELEARVLALQDELDVERRKRAALQGESERRWFLTGAGVLAGGLLLGLVLPHLRRRRRDSWS